MGATSTDYLAMKLDKIEDMVRELKQLLTERSTSAPSSPSAAPATPGVRMWRLSTKPLMWLVRTFWKFLPTLATLVYLRATGQSDKIIAYLNSFVGV